MITRFLDRQLKLFLSRITDYRSGLRSLNSTLGDLEALARYVTDGELLPNLIERIHEAEIINAMTIETSEGLTSRDKLAVNKLMVEMEKLVLEFCQANPVENNDDDAE